MSKIEQIKIPVEIEEIQYKLTKIDEGFGAKFASKISWIEWNEDGTFKQKHDDPAVGRSLIMDPQHMNFTWMTTTVTEIVEQTEDVVVFKTLNSFYKLEKIKEDEAGSI